MDEDYCYECTGYGDDYFLNDDGELECYCPQCPMNPYRDDEELDDGRRIGGKRNE